MPLAHLSQKLALAHTYNPKNWQKNVTLVAKKTGKIFLGRFLSKGRLNLLAKYSEPKKQFAKKEFLLELQEF